MKAMGMLNPQNKNRTPLISVSNKREKQFKKYKNPTLKSLTRKKNTAMKKEMKDHLQI